MIRICILSIGLEIVFWSKWISHNLYFFRSGPRGHFNKIPPFCFNTLVLWCTQFSFEIFFLIQSIRMENVFLTWTVQWTHVKRISIYIYIYFLWEQNAGIDFKNIFLYNQFFSLFRVLWPIFTYTRSHTFHLIKISVPYKYLWEIFKLMMKDWKIFFVQLFLIISNWNSLLFFFLF